MKRSISLLIIAALAVMMLAGCGKEEKEKVVLQAQSERTVEEKSLTDSEGHPEGEAPAQTGPEVAAEDPLASIRPKEPVTLTVYSQLSNYLGEEQTGWFAKIIKDKFNIKIKYVYPGDNEGYLKSIDEEGRLPDICLFGSNTGPYRDMYEQGYLLDWEKDGLFDKYGKTIKEHMKILVENNKKNASDGKLYGIGNDVAYGPGEYAQFDYHPDIRYDLYEQLGKPEINELEDYVGVLKRMKEICPTSDSGEETYGVSLFSDWDGSMVMFVKATATDFFGVDEFGTGFYVADTGEFQGCLEDDGYYLRCLKFYNDLYRNDLVDPDSRIQGYAGTVEDYRDGRAFMCIFSWMGADLYNSVEHMTSGKMLLPIAAKNQKTLVYSIDQSGGVRMWTISADTEYPELCMAFIDWMCTAEGKLTSLYGPRGLGWEYDNDGNAILLTIGYKGLYEDDFSIDSETGYDGMWREGLFQGNNTTWSKYTKNYENPSQTYNAMDWSATYAMHSSDIEMRWMNEYGVKTTDEYMSLFNHSICKSYTYIEGGNPPENFGNILDNVSRIVRENSWKAIFADSDEEYNKLVEEMKSKAYEAGYEVCVDWYTEQAALRRASEID